MVQKQGMIGMEVSPITNLDNINSPAQASETVQSQRRAWRGWAERLHP